MENNKENINCEKITDDSVSISFKRDYSLKDTVDLMFSPDYKDRLIAEYLQTKYRYENLKYFNNRIEANTYALNLNVPSHDCPLSLLKAQQKAMGEYLHLLELRAVVENINLEDYKCN